MTPSFDSLESRNVPSFGTWEVPEAPDLSAIMQILESFPKVDYGDALPQGNGDAAPWRGRHAPDEAPPLADTPDTPGADAPGADAPDDAPADDADQTLQVVQLVNEARASEGLDPLTVSDKLTQAANLHAQNMAETGNLTHGDVESRLEDVGYVWSTYGENIAWGYESAEEVVQGWLDSPGHRENIMDPDFTEVGVGVAVTEDGWYWTQDFGRPTV